MSIFFSMNHYDPDQTGMPYEDFTSLYNQDFNARMKCGDLPKPDLKKWRHGPYIH